MAFLERLKRLLSVSGHGENGDGECQDCRPITCAEALERVYEYLDGELDEADRREVRHHFSVCKRCYPHLELEERFLELLHSTRGGVRTPDSLKDQVLGLLAAEAEKNG